MSEEDEDEISTQGVKAPQLAKRRFKSKCLWLLRMDSADIAKMHQQQGVLMSYDYSNKNLDIVEVAALYAHLPKQFNQERPQEQEE